MKDPATYAEAAFIAAKHPQEITATDNAEPLLSTALPNLDTAGT